MSLRNKNPLYDEFFIDWVTMRDTFKGQRAIKDKTYTYLPATDGQERGGLKKTTDLGYKAYQAYLIRATFPEFVNDAVRMALGVMHRKEATILLPKKMEFLRENATVDGESLTVLLKRINEEQLVTGRLGLMLDLPVRGEIGTPRLYVAMYKAPTIINWDNGTRDGLTKQVLNLVVLDETEYVRGNDFSWDEKQKYRVLSLGDMQTNEATGVYQQGVFEEAKTFTEEGLMTPTIRGKEFNEIPFTFINGRDVVPAPESPPLLGLANLALAAYRLSADYRQALFMQGQDTLVTEGLQLDDEDEIQLGALGSIDLPMGGDAKFIGVSGDGLSEMREALRDDHRQAAVKGGNLLDTTSRERESGDALVTRVTSQTTTLNQIAIAGAFGLESLLKQAARWMGENEEEVKVTPNLDFANDKIDGNTLLAFMNAKQMGAPWSLESIHQFLRERDLTKLSFEEELKKIEEERDLDMSFNIDTNTLVDGIVDDDAQDDE